MKFRLCGYGLLISLICLGIVACIVERGIIKCGTIGLGFNAKPSPMVLAENVIIPNCASDIKIRSICDYVIGICICGESRSWHKTIPARRQKHRMGNYFWKFINPFEISAWGKHSNIWNNINSGSAASIFKRNSKRNPNPRLCGWVDIKSCQHIRGCDPCPFIFDSRFFHLLILSYENNQNDKSSANSDSFQYPENTFKFPPCCKGLPCLFGLFLIFFSVFCHWDRWWVWWIFGFGFALYMVGLYWLLI